MLSCQLVHSSLHRHKQNFFHSQRKIPLYRFLKRDLAQVDSRGNWCMYNWKTLGKPLQVLLQTQIIDIGAGSREQGAGSREQGSPTFFILSG